MAAGLRDWAVSTVWVLAGLLLALSMLAVPLLAVSPLAALDEFEGEHVFRRTRISVEGVSGPVEAYLYVEPAPDAPDCGVSWPPA